MLITEIPEIDLYETMKYDQIRNNGQIRAYLPQPYQSYVYVSLCRTKQRYGWRIWFLAPCCKRRTSKLYLLGRSMGCRHCLELRYPSQYRKDVFNRSDMTERKLTRLKKQKRRLWYCDYPTQFGLQYQRLVQEMDRHHDKMLGNVYEEAMKLKMAVALAPTES
jgi:hypothetical protein